MSLLDAFSTQYDTFYNSAQSPVVNVLLKNDEGITDQMLIQVGEMVPACKDTALGNSEILADRFKAVSEQYSGQSGVNFIQG